MNPISSGASQQMGENQCNQEDDQGGSPVKWNDSDESPNEEVARRGIRANIGDDESTDNEEDVHPTASDSDRKSQPGLGTHVIDDHPRGSKSAQELEVIDHTQTLSSRGLRFKSMCIVASVQFRQ